MTDDQKDEYIAELVNLPLLELGQEVAREIDHLSRIRTTVFRKESKTRIGIILGILAIRVEKELA